VREAGTRDENIHKTIGRKRGREEREREKEREKEKNSQHVDVLLTADAPLSRVAQFARHDAAAE